MRKSKKTIAILAIIAMVLMMIPVQAVAAGNATATSRLSGATRVDTAIAIANNGWANGATNVVVVPANDENLVDALAVAPLAKQLNAPILITDKASLDASVSAEIATLKAANVYAVGALSDAVVSQLKALSGVTVTPVKGADRFATATQIASMLKSPAGSIVVGYNGLADALSAASFAAANGYAILVANTDGTVPANEATYEGSKVVELGGPTLVADIAGATRYYGADRYATNDQVIKNLSFKYDKVYVANGDTLVDALSGAVLAAMTNSPIVLANTQGAAAAADVFKNLTTSSQVVAFGGTGVVPDSVVTGVQTGKTGGNTAPSGPVTVQSVKASASNAFQVTFSSAPADTSKVVFTVQMSSTTPFTVTTAWDSTNTVATLTYSSNFPAGSYTVGVKNDTNDLGTSTVSVTQEAISKINITSDKLSVTSAGYGFATYQVIDQYGNDITDSYLANSINFQTGVGTIYANKGLIKVTPSSNINLIQFSTVVITGNDTNSGISVTKTLTTSTALGTLSSVTLNKLTSPNNAVLTAGDTSDVWYIDYTATDMSGNPTNNYQLVKGGLILTDNANGKGTALSTSSPYVLANLIEDPNDTNNAAIQVKVTSATIPTDLPLTITALSYNGSSTLNVTFKKQSAVDSFTLMAPSYNIASSEYKQIPFVAYDQNGTQLTKYSDINGNVTLSGGAVLVQNVDGTASVYVNANANSTSSAISQTVTAVTPTGKLSTLTLSIQPAAVADTLNVDSSVLVNAMQVSTVSAVAYQYVDFGLTYGGLSVEDQYGRSIDMTGKHKSYVVYATADPNGEVTVPTGSAVAYADQAITIESNTASGQGTVTFNLVDTNQQDSNGNYILTGSKTTPTTANYTVSNLANLTAIDSKTESFSVLKNTDIKGYTIDTVANPIYADPDNTGAPATQRAAAFDAEPYVWGTTSSASKVVLAGTPVIGAYVDNTTDFAVDQTVYNGAGAWTASGVYPTDYQGVYVAAKNLPVTKTTSSATLTVTIMGADNAIHSVTTPITSSSTAPVAKTISASVATWKANSAITLNSAGDVATVHNGVQIGTDKLGNPVLANSLFANGKSLGRFDNTGTNNRAGVYFYAKDSYGTKAMQLSQFTVVATGVVDKTGNIVYGNDGNPVAAYDTFTLDSPVNGNINVNTLGQSASLTNGQGEYVTLTAVTNNGLVDTIRINFYQN